MKIHVKSPTRVDLAGGTLDMWPLYNFVQGPVLTINVAISVLTQVEIKSDESGKITLHSKDFSSQKEYSDLDSCLHDQDPSWAIFREQIRYWASNPSHSSQLKSGFAISTSSQSPVGGGLGGSSSLTISMMKAFSKMLAAPFSDTHRMVHAAHNIESKILRTPTGTQDYYPAASGGLNILTYSSDGINQEVLSTEKYQQLSDRMLLVYTGRSHHSGLNNFEVLKAAVSGEKKTLMALQRIAEVAVGLRQSIQFGQWEQLQFLFQEEYKARIELCEAFTSPEIQKLAEISQNTGAEAIKICGAGGGGCVMIWCKKDNRKEIALECQKAGFQVMDTQIIAPLI